MSGVQSFRDLLAYQRARKLAGAIRRHSARYPREDRYELTSQMRRAASSIALNIAEGYGVGTPPATLRHLRIARGSLRETEAALDLAEEYEFAPPPAELCALLDETARLLQSLITSMERKLPLRHQPLTRH
jgi:four helix bundle protein